MNVDKLDANLGISSTPDTVTTPDANTPATSSPATETTTPPSSGTDAPAPSSSAKDPKEALLAVVENVIEKGNKPSSTDEPAKAKTDATPQGSTEGQDTSSGADPTDIPASEMAKYTPNAQRRIKELIDANKALRRDMEQYAPVIEGQRQMVEFMEANNLTNEHVQTLFNFGAALRRGDFSVAKDLVEPYYFAIKEALGEKLQDDLQAQVADGLVDENLAREMTRLRSENSRLKTTVQEVGETQQQAAQRQTVQTIHDAVANWEKTIKARDPDFAMKSELLQDAARAVLAEKGLPAARNPQEAVALAQAAYDRVNARVSKFRPAAQPTRPAPTSGSSVATSVAAKPKTLLDAVEIGLAQNRGGL